MSASGLVFVLIAAVLSTGANFMLRAGLDAAGGFAPGSVAKAVSDLLRLFVHPVFVAGVVAYILGNLAWFRTIASEPLSIAFPILVGLMFILMTSGAAAFFHEPVTARKVVGLITILGGIILTSMETAAR